MGQITKATIEMIRHSIDEGHIPPLTLWEYRQLANMAEQQIAGGQAEQPSHSMTPGDYLPHEEGTT